LEDIVGSDSGPSLSSILGDEGMSAASSPSPRAPASQTRIDRHRGNAGDGLPTLLGRIAKVSRPRCWIGDTGCGHDLLSQKWVDGSEKDCLVPVDNPPQFSGVGGCMTAQMKLPLMSQALSAVVDPYVLPATPDVLSNGKRCVKEGWSFWWPPWSKRPVLTPPKGKGSPST